MTTKQIFGVVSLIATLAFAVQPASAAGELRGGMTSISSIHTQANAANSPQSRWSNREQAAVSSHTAAARGDFFKWASKTSHADDSAANLVQADATLDATESRHRWGIKASADQARHRWGIKADGEQARHRWGIK